jgi:hypothetical protein
VWVVGDGDRALSRKKGVRSVARGADVDYTEMFQLRAKVKAKGLYLGSCFHSFFKLFIVYIRKVVPEARRNLGVLRASKSVGVLHKERLR